MSKTTVRKRLLGGVLIASLFGCGGLMNDEFGSNGSYEVTPLAATIAPNGTVQIAVNVTNYAVISYRFSVKGNNSGSILVHTTEQNKATYTAPDVPGTYQVVAGFKELTGKVYEKTVTITVQAPG